MNSFQRKVSVQQNKWVNLRDLKMNNWSLLQKSSNMIKSYNFVSIIYVPVMFWNIFFEWALKSSHKLEYGRLLYLSMNI